MALKADVCSVMHAMMLPGKGLGFNHSGSRMISNLISFGSRNAPTSLPCLSLRNGKQHSNYNRKQVLCMSTQRATQQSAAVKHSEVQVPKEAPSIIPKPGETYRTKVVSVNTLVGPKGGLGEICHIVLDHGGKFQMVEGQYLGVILYLDDDDSRRAQTLNRVHYFSIASCRDGDSFDGKRLSLCVRRAELFPESVSNFLCNLKEGDEVDIKGPFGKTMVFPEDPEAKHIMVATLTGIAPFRSNLQWLFEDPKQKVKFNGLAWLIDGADNYNSLLYNIEFTQILNNNPDHFRYERALNNSVADCIYENGDDIFTLLDGGAYIYFAGSKTMMPGILETFQKIADERGVIWEEMLAQLKKKNRWRVEVY